MTITFWTLLILARNFKNRKNLTFLLKSTWLSQYNTYTRTRTGARTHTQTHTLTTYSECILELLLHAKVNLWLAKVTLKPVTLNFALSPFAFLTANEIIPISNLWSSDSLYKLVKMAPLAVTEAPTKAFAGQKPGTSGLRKKVSEFTQPHYMENFIQCTLLAVGDKLKGSTLVIFLIKYNLRSWFTIKLACSD